MVNGGWICLHRSIKDHWVWSDADKFRAWVDLLMLANWEPRTVAVGSRLIDVGRGSFITSQVKLAERWKWSRFRVQSFLKTLEKLEMISTKTSRSESLISIINYESYQGEDKGSKHQKSIKKASGKHQKSTTNNITNKQDNKIPPYPPLWDSSTIEAFQLWEEHRRQIRKKLTQSSVKSIFKKYQDHPQRFIAAVEHSVANGYQGLFEGGGAKSSKSRNAQNADSTTKTVQEILSEAYNEQTRDGDSTRGNLSDVSPGAAYT